MSFSSQAKAELCRQPISRKCCAQAECYGILLYANRFDSSEVKIVTESEDFAQRIPGLFQKAFHLAFDRLPQPGQGGKLVFSITAFDEAGKIGECTHERFIIEEEKFQNKADKKKMA